MILICVALSSTRNELILLLDSLIWTESIYLSFLARNQKVHMFCVCSGSETAALQNSGHAWENSTVKGVNTTTGANKGKNMLTLMHCYFLFHGLKNSSFQFFLTTRSIQMLLCGLRLLAFCDEVIGKLFMWWGCVPATPLWWTGRFCFASLPDKKQTRSFIWKFSRSFRS